MRVSLEHKTKTVLELVPSWYCFACGVKSVWAVLHSDNLSTGRHAGTYGCSSCYETWHMSPWVDDGGPDMRAVRDRLKT
jgi:hypothetical protein